MYNVKCVYEKKHVNICITNSGNRFAGRVKSSDEEKRGYNYQRWSKSYEDVFLMY